MVRNFTVYISASSTQTYSRDGHPLKQSMFLFCVKLKQIKIEQLQDGSLNKHS
jgi:hypothetical protein